LIRPIEPGRDHVRGGGVRDLVTVVVYADLLCPYCQRLRQVMMRLREALGRRIVYVFRHFPNERAHPGAERLARAAEAAAKQNRFWEMYDWVYGRQPPISDTELFEFVRSLGIDMARFEADLESSDVRQRVEEDLAEGRRNGVTGTPTLFVDGIRYDGAWDFYSMLEALERPVAARVQRSARVFASLPASGGLVLLLAAAAALVCANTPLRPSYEAMMRTPLTFGPERILSLTVAEWCSEGLLAFFFLLVGLEIRRETTAGALSDARAAALPVISAVGGVLAPAAIYLALNRGPTASGWSIPTATDIAFTLGILALLGDRIPSTLRVFVATLAVADDVLSVLTLAIFYPQSFHVPWLLASALATALLYTLNRWRTYALWPYAFVTAFLWIALHMAGVDAALTGVILAAFLPVQPAPSAAPLLAQAATALAALEHAENEAKQAGGERRSLQQEPVWDWASRNLSAASGRLLSAADRIELAVAPWSNYVVLPLFAFSATGVAFAVDFSQPGAHQIALGIILGLVIGKPLGVSFGAWLGVKSKLASMPDGVTLHQFLGAACLCGVADTLALLLADRASLPGTDTAIAKIAVLVASVIAATLGTIILVTGSRTVARTPAA
jgi:NhaA family Na+:H+ antiporter